MRRTLAVALALVLASTATAVDADLRKQVKDPDSFERIAAARALGKEGTPDAAKLLLELLADRNPYVRDYTVLACKQVRDAAAVEVLAGAFREKDELLRANLAAALGHTRSAAALDVLERLALDDRSAAVRSAALDALWGFREDERAAGIARRGRMDEQAAVRAAALEALGRMRTMDAPELCAGGLGDADEGVRCVARMELRFVDPDAAREDLATASADGGWRTRAQAVENAFWLRDVVSMETLVARVGDTRLRVSAAAHRALVELSGKELGRDRDLWRTWWRQNAETWEPPPTKRSGRPPVPPGGTRATYYGLEVLSDDVVFVLDASGSMDNEIADKKTRWDAALEELRGTLAALPDGVRVNVIFFQHEALAALPRPAPLGRKSRKQLGAFLKRTNPGRAGNLLAALLLALDQEGADTVYLLSDGAPSFGDMVVKERVRARVRAINRTRKLVVNCIGFGAEKATERSFLEGLARDSMGRAVFR